MPETALPDGEGRVVGPGFHGKVHAFVRRVPRGRVTTYGDVAEALGSRRVARHVGFALAALPSESRVPWHRVVNAQGKISFPAEDDRALQQRLRLEGEGVALTEAGGVVDFGKRRWSPTRRRGAR